MELRHIRYFLKIAEEGNFTRAAAQLGIGQPPLSQQIHNLEAEIGYPLFHRLSHGVELTPAGQAFYEKVQDFPQRAFSSILAAQKAARGETGTLALGITGATALNPHVPHTIRDFRHKFPGVELKIEEANGLELIKHLYDGRLDVAIFRSSSKDPDDLHIVKLGQEELMAALPANHPLAQNNHEININDLCDEPLILTPRDLGTSLHDATIKAFKDAGIEPKLGPPAPHIASIMSLVSAELGVALVPKSTRQLALDGVKFIPLIAPAPKITLIIGSHKTKSSPIAQNFIALATKVFAS